MNTAYFIAKKISRVGRGQFSSIVHKIAVTSVALGLAASIISFLVMEGFQHVIKDKIYAFSSHIIVSKFTTNNSLEVTPMSCHIDLYDHHEKYDYVDRVQKFAYKAGLIKTEKEALGIVFKGVGDHFNRDSFASTMTEGKFVHFPDSGYALGVVVSQIIADKIQVAVDDYITVHFFQNPPRFRKLRVTGIYETHLSDYFDDKVIMGDIRLIQRLNNWSDSMVSGMEIYLKDSQHLDEAYEAIEEDIAYDVYMKKVNVLYAEIFDWLDLIGRQVNIILLIILIVVCINMISVILIMVMERTQMIGVLKAMGAHEKLIRLIFLHLGTSLILRGLVYGNLLGLGLCFIQDTFKIFRLNARDYYMDYAPIVWDWNTVLFLNGVVFIATVAMLFLPTIIISRITPVKAIRFD